MLQKDTEAQGGEIEKEKRSKKKGETQNTMGVQ